jgi:hypothetical protein
VSEITKDPAVQTVIRLHTARKLATGGLGHVVVSTEDQRHFDVEFGGPLGTVRSLDGESRRTLDAICVALEAQREVRQ